ncbi:MAG: hypothetical protein JXA30_08845 [Deltaproteobacteria bacterium]|nr:hypothetical protein [Deltaproteobacteria bacterium]
MKFVVYISGALLLLLAVACSSSGSGQLGPVGGAGSGVAAGTQSPGQGGTTTQPPISGNAPDTSGIGGGGGPITGPTGGNTPVSTGGASGPQTGSGGTTVVNPIDAGPLDGGGTQPNQPVEPEDKEPVVTSKDPKIPEIAGDCPPFARGAFNFMGLSGLMEVGAKSNGTAPLVWFWHGTVMAASSYIGIPVAMVTGEGGVIVAPNGPAAGEAGAMCSGTMIFGDTVTWEVMDQITACAVRDYGVDPHRIYGTGCSAGGLQSGCMAGRRSAYVAAVAPNSGGLVMPFMQWQDPGHVPAVMTMHGGPADVVGISFTTSSASLDSAAKTAGGFVVNCNHGGMHCGAPGNLYQAAIEFFYAHPFGFDVSPYEGGLPANFPSYCSIYE